MAQRKRKLKSIEMLEGFVATDFHYLQLSLIFRQKYRVWLCVSDRSGNFAWKVLAYR